MYMGFELLNQEEDKKVRENRKRRMKDIQNSNLIELVSTSPYHAPEPWVINTNSPIWTDIGAIAVTEHLHFECNLIAFKAWWALRWYSKGWLIPNNRPRVNIWGNIRTPSFKTWKKNSWEPLALKNPDICGVNQTWQEGEPPICQTQRGLASKKLVVHDNI